MLLACAPGVPAVQDRLLNGDFTAPLDSGWFRDARNFSGSGAIRPLPGGGVIVQKVQCGWTRLSQKFLLPDRHVTFSTEAQLRVTVNRSGYFAAAAVVVEYLDAGGQPLGETRFQAVAGRRPWSSTPTRHFIPVAANGTRHELELDVADELRRHLSGFKPADVAALRVTLEAYGSNTAGC